MAPDGGDAGKPDDHEDAGDVDRGSDAVVVGAKNADGEVNEECGNKISGEADALIHIFVDFI